jgi:outer membrane biosynthesis protein TonB
MKHTTGYDQPRKLARPKKQVQLNLRGRRAKPEPAGDIELEQKNSFWKWVGIVALLHVVVITLVSIYYSMTPTPQPQEPMISLLPPGQDVKGTPEPSAAPKMGLATPAPSVPHHAETPPPAPTPPVVSKPKLTPAPDPQPIVKSEAPTPIQDKPAPVKPAPAKPKVKVDLTLADAPNSTTHPTKPKVHPKKPTLAKPDDTDAPDKDAPASQTDGLSKEQIAKRLGDKMNTVGSETAVKHGTDGSDHAQENPFQDFYRMVHDQVMANWTSPNLTDTTAVNPQVTIHVEKDGTVPPDLVTLTRSSGNATYDETALAAAKSLGRLLEPLPDGCNPDIHIDFKLTRD